MNTLREFVEYKLTHCDKTAEANGYPLKMENCKKNKKMRDLKVYGNSVQDGTPTPDNPIDIVSVGELVTDTTDANYGKYKIPVTVHGKNLATAYDVCKNLASYKETTLDGRECVSYASNYGYRYNNYPFKENTQYTISFYVKSVRNHTLTGFNMILGFTYTDGSQPAATYKDTVYSYNDGVNDVEWRKVTITSRAGKTVKAIGTDGNHYTLTHYIDVNTFQIEEGATATECEPYVEPVTTNIFLNEPLRKIGDYADYIDGKNKKVVRNVYKAIISKSNLSWSLGVSVWQREGHTDFLGMSVEPIISQGYKGYSNRFIAGNWTWSGNTFPCNYFLIGVYQNKYIHFIINNDYLDGITDESTSDEKIAAFKKFLAENETYVVYPRKTPTEEPIICELPKLNAKTTIIEVDTSLLPSNAYGKYIKK